MQVDLKTASGLCATCVSKLSDPPPMPKPTVIVTVEEKKARKEMKLEKKKATLEAKKNAKRGKGRGWHLKQLFEFDGEFYSFGKPVGDAEVAKIRRALKKGGK